MVSWRARCGESRTPGSEGGLGKRAAGNGGTAPRSDPYPERAACLSLWVYGVVWSWYVTTQGTRRSWPELPWYRSKCTPSFVDALPALRRVLWSRTIFATSEAGLLDPKMTDTLLETPLEGQRSHISRSATRAGNWESPPAVKRQSL